MAINSKTLSSVQSKVTGLTTNETDFRAGVDDALTQIDASEVLLSNVDSSDLTKLAAVTATAAELNVLDGITASTSELNITDGLTATTSELNILDGATLTTTELNLLDGVTSTTAELNKLDGYTGTYEDLNKIADVTATAAELNTLDGFTGNTADLNRTVELDAAGDGTSGQVLTSDGDGTYSWTTPSSFTFVIEDEDGTEVSIDTDEIKFQGDGMDIDWGAGDGTDGNPYILNIDNADKGSSQNIFKNIAVSGQTTIQADSNNDTLTVVGGNNITVTTNASTDTITITGDVAAPGNGLVQFSGGDVTSSDSFSLNDSSGTTVDLSITAGAVGTTELAGQAVTTGKIADQAVTGAKIAAGSIADTKLEDNAVITSKINNGAVTSDKINTDAVTNIKIADNAVHAAQLNVSGNGTAGQVLESDGDGSFSWATPETPFTPSVGSNEGTSTGTARITYSHSSTSFTNSPSFTVPSGQVWFVSFNDGVGSNTSNFHFRSSTGTYIPRWGFVGPGTYYGRGRKVIVSYGNGDDTDNVYSHYITEIRAWRVK